MTKESIVKRNSVVGISASALLILLATWGSGSASASPSDNGRVVTLTAHLTELNGSGASGTATAVIHNKKIKSIEVHATGLTPDAPHAQHIHYGNQASNECPTLAHDTNPTDGRINTLEGVPAYGPVVVSLTTRGDTSPSSVLAVDRYPVAVDGRIDYKRTNIKFTDVAGTGYPGPGGLGTAQEIADSIRDGEGVVVIHGLDYDGSETYSFSAEGSSELDSSLPAEATDPAACGVLR